MKTLNFRQFKIEWRDGGRKSKVPPSPLYPDGLDFDVSGGQRSCATNVPYPAPRCGMWRVTCHLCGFSALVTAAGRRDDPRSVRLPCKTQQRGDA